MALFVIIFCKILVFRKRLCYSNDCQEKIPEVFLDSSMVEHSAVNRRVVGSSPTRGAKMKKRYRNEKS